MLRSIIGLNDLGISYNCLLGLEMTTVDDLLKWAGQCPKLMQVFTMLTILVRYLLCLRMDLRWFHDSLSSSGMDKLLQLLIAQLNSSLENNVQKDRDLLLILSSISILICWWRAVLNVEWRVFQRLLRVRYSWLSYLIASIASSFHLLTQLISFQGPWLLLVISWILMSKKALLVDFTVLLKDF